MTAQEGLSAAQAASRLERYGRNDLVPTRKSGSLAAWLMRLVLDPMVILLAVAGVTYALLGDRFDAAVVAIALLPIFAVTGVLEYRSDRALESLSRAAPPRACVVRDGAETLIPAFEVVPGDLLVLREGDVIAADGHLLQGNRLQVDESALTGESLPVEKSVSAEAATSVLAGTIVRSGRAIALVDLTGAQTEYGRIGRGLGKVRTRKSPIEKSIHRIVFQLGVAVVFGCALVVAVQRWHGDGWATAIIAGVSLAMAAIPEELPMVYTLYLALGAWRLAKDEALARNLSSVETLGSTTVICVDKTGTLTYGKLSVQSVIAADGWTEKDVLEAAARASDERSGDPIDKAILARLGTQLDTSGRLLEVPFDPDRRYAAAVWRDGRNCIVVAKGAFETLLHRCGSVPNADLAGFHDAATGSGGRVIAVARGNADCVDAQSVEKSALTLIGLVTLADSVRPQAVEAIARCRRAGIRFVMITGDHPATAKAIASAVGLDAASVFARVRPEEKLRIVRALHENGDVVAMTGDGTNDALALREADIGVAMGRSGTEVARAAADLVLLDDDVTTIVRAVADGRRIFSNLRHAFTYLVAFHAPLLVTAFLLPLLGVPTFLLPIHLIWLELIVHPTSALVFENDPPHPNVMEEPPRKASSGLLRPIDWFRASVVGLGLALSVTLVFISALGRGLSPDEARAMGLVTMIAGQMTLVFIERAEYRPVWTVSLRQNKAILPVVLGTAAMLAVALIWQPVTAALHLAPISLALVSIACAIGCASVLWVQPFLALRSYSLPLALHTGANQRS